MDKYKVNAVYLNDAFNPKRNNFTVMRFVLAALVVFSHSYTLGGFGSEGLFGNSQETYGGLAVTSFFILSGFLINRSYINSSSVWRFLWNRILRIFPGFWTCLIVTVFIFAPIIYLSENGNLNGYFHASVENPLNYIKANFFLEIGQYGIANLLVNNIPYPRAFNGSLWTLIYEFRCYLMVAILGFLGVFTFYKKIVFYIFIFLWLTYNLNLVIPGTASKVLPYFSDIYILKLSIYFFVGCIFFLYREKIVLNKQLFIFSIILIMMGLNHGFYNLVAPLALPYILFWLAFKTPFINFDRYGDFSYGLYIYAFPVQQMLAFFGVHKNGFILYLSLSMLVTMILAVLSYMFIEKPCLQMKNLTFKDVSFLTKKYFKKN
ncbi:acyltransferase [Calothrix sp. FACHB-1219]|uniref:acyltransferase family protein n=1 Tax=unclassified Calothrix TaxID=2619626 RepID=UPI001683B3B4|nr:MULTISPECIES: acyltransferase [unclassified Calothrix]MBD2206526.1 acyltransferase [Calothrix sp. FACHB-168]MBD2221322.1 acyltransferase [Calothrix sp. FACHB-1219]